jgi:hypothetical protein
LGRADHTQWLAVRLAYAHTVEVAPAVHAVRLEVGAARGAGRVPADDVVLVTGDGDEHRLDVRGFRAYDAKLASHSYRKKEIDPNRPEPLFGFLDVPAGMSRTTVAIFDVPPEAAEGARLAVGGNAERTLFELE